MEYNRILEKKRNTLNKTYHSQDHKIGYFEIKVEVTDVLENKH